MKYNVIQTGDYTLGLVKDVISYLLEMKKDLQNKNLGDVGMDLDYFLYKDNQIKDILLELKDRNSFDLIKLYNNEFDELKWEEINI